MKNDRQFITCENKKKVKKGENIFKQSYYMILFSLYGLRSAWRNEKSFRLHFVTGFCLPIALAITCTFLKVPLSSLQWFITVSLGCILISVELLNSAVENCCDLVSTEHNPLIKNAKDMGSAAVFVVGCAAFVFNFIIYIEKLLKLLNISF